MNIYLDLYWTFFKIGLFTFGGGYAMLPMLESECVTKKKWATYDQLMDYFAIGQCTPGVIAVNTSTFMGYSQKKVPGAICATMGIISPSLIIIALIASVLTSFADIPAVQHALAGIRIAVCVLILNATVKLFRNSVKNIFGVILFLAALLLSAFNVVSVVWIIIGAASAGILYSVLTASKSGKAAQKPDRKNSSQTEAGNGKGENRDV